MKISPPLFLALLTISFPTVCRANLGATEAQCIAKYGSESELRDNLGFDVVGDKSASFNLKTAKDSLVINIIFLNGVAAREDITNADSSRGIPEDEKKALLDSEGAGLIWTKTRTIYNTDRSDNTYETESWLRSDGATAKCWMYGKIHFNGWGQIEISTSSYTAAQRDLDRQNGSGG